MPIIHRRPKRTIDYAIASKTGEHAPPRIWLTDIKPHRDQTSFEFATFDQSGFGQDGITFIDYDPTG